MAKLQAIVYMVFIALFLTQESTQKLQDRSAYYGGFSLNIDLATNCPTNSFSCSYWNVTGSAQGGPCCPIHTFCTSNGKFCCPTSDDCSTDVVNSPTCGDSSWTLFSNGESDFWCCPSGMVVDGAGECTQPTATGYFSQVTAFTTQTQENNASPTGDGTATPPTGAGGITSLVAAPPTTARTSAGSGVSSPTTAGVGSSATKQSSANKKFVAQEALAYAIIVAPLLL